MRFTWLLLAMLVSFSLCGCKHEQVPEGIMDTATLADFIVEAQLIDSYRNIMSAYNRDSIDSIADAAFASLYAKFNITPAVYDSTISYYMCQKGVLEEVYNRVIADLQNQSSMLPDAAPTQFSVPDSVEPSQRIVNKMMSFHNQ